MNNQLTATPVVILGMHRSGTSCLAGSLQEAGLYLGDVNERAGHNAKGNRENRAIMALNDDVLHANDGSWQEPPDTVVWNSRQKASRDELIAAYPANQPWGFKDPRTLLTLDGWLEKLSSAKCVGTFRHPVAVARSLRARNKFSRKKCFSLWLAYNRLLLHYQRQLGFDLVCFDWPADDYLEKLARVVANLNLTKSELEFSFFESRLRKNDRSGGISRMVARFSTPARLPEQVSKMYQTLQDIAV